MPEQATAQNPLNPFSKPEPATPTIQDKAAETKQLIHKIHVAVNDGTLDRASVNDALRRLTELHVNEPAEADDKPSIAETADTKAAEQKH